jgi:hypothetical protein
MKTNNSWGDNDKSFGPFTWTKTHYKKYGVILDSGGGKHSDNPCCNLRLHFHKTTAIINLPPIIKLHKLWVDTESGGYWSSCEKQYGYFIDEDTLHLKFGAQSDFSTTRKTRVYFLPWADWRFIRHSLFDDEGKHFKTFFENETIPEGEDKFKITQRFKDACPKIEFLFSDYDNEIINAVTFIEEREWRRGDGWFKWLSLVSRPKIKRVLEIEFSKGTGRNKKIGRGYTAISIDLLPNELHEAAFKRHCSQFEMTYIGTSSSKDATIAILTL